MLKEQNAERHGRLEKEMGQFVYRRLMLTRELETIDKNIAQLEGAIRENEATLRDLQTQEAIDKAQAEVKEDGGKENA